MTLSPRPGANLATLRAYLAQARMTPSQYEQLHA
jgi:hypothetical protein